jgi:tRNA modification GTPase
MFLGDTIAAISTPPGRGGIGVVRLSGPSALETANTIFHSESHSPIEPGRARLGRVIDPATADLVDEAILTYFKAPHSYTGEDVVELSCHGSPVILGRTLRIIVQHGVRVAPASLPFAHSSTNG